jgi:hypothetical protein
MSDKLNIANEMKMFDRKVRSFYDSLEPDELKKFSTYLMIRWGSCVDGSKDLQEFYVIATNERLNKHFFTMSRHPKLQWLMATTVSPDVGTPRHNWISTKKKDKVPAEIKKKITEMYPHLKDDEIELMIRLSDKKEINAYIRDHGDTN